MGKSRFETLTTPTSNSLSRNARPGKRGKSAQLPTGSSSRFSLKRSHPGESSSVFNPPVSESPSDFIEGSHDRRITVDELVEQPQRAGSADQHGVRHCDEDELLVALARASVPLTRRLRVLLT